MTTTSSEKIKNLRREKQLTQDELAKELGVSRQTIFAIESGRSEPSLALALRLCSMFDSAIDEIFSDFFMGNTHSISQLPVRKEVKEMTRDLLPWSPLSDLTDLHREIDRFFEGAVTSPRSVAYIGAMNIKDLGDKFEVEIVVPGFSEEDIEVEVGQDIVTVKGEKKSEIKEDEEGYLRKEFSTAKFERSFALTTQVKADAVEAEIKHGTLRLSLPKIEPTPPKVTRVKVKKQG